MKTLKSLTIICLLFLCGAATSQNNKTKSWIIIESIQNEDGLSKAFKQKAITMVKEFDKAPSADKLGNFEIQDLMLALNNFESAVFQRFTNWPLGG